MKARKAFANHTLFKGLIKFTFALSLILFSGLSGDVACPNVEPARTELRIIAGRVNSGRTVFFQKVAARQVFSIGLSLRDYAAVELTREVRTQLKLNSLIFSSHKHKDNHRLRHYTKENSDESEANSQQG
jgi:hypothetical protein